MIKFNKIIANPPWTRDFIQSKITRFLIDNIKYDEFVNYMPKDSYNFYGLDKYAKCVINFNSDYAVDESQTQYSSISKLGEKNFDIRKDDELFNKIKDRFDSWLEESKDLTEKWGYMRDASGPDVAYNLVCSFDDVNGTILDPCMGCGANLLVAMILAGADPKKIYGIELNEDNYNESVRVLSKFGVPKENLHLGDCLDLENYCFENNKSLFNKKQKPIMHKWIKKFDKILLDAPNNINRDLSSRITKFLIDNIKYNEFIDYMPLTSYIVDGVKDHVDTVIECETNYRSKTVQHHSIAKIGHKGELKLKTDELLENKIQIEFDKWFEKMFSRADNADYHWNMTAPDIAYKMICALDDVNGTILDPCMGYGANLLVAAIIAGADPKKCYGIEINPLNYEASVKRLTALGVPRENLMYGSCLAIGAYNFSTEGVLFNEPFSDAENDDAVIEEAMKGLTIVTPYSSLDNGILDCMYQNVSIFDKPEFKGKIEFIFVSNACKDEILLINKLHTFSYVKFLATDSDSGLGEARNRGLFSATKSNILFLDPTDLLMSPYFINDVLAVKKPIQSFCKLSNNCTHDSLNNNNLEEVLVYKTLFLAKNNITYLELFRDSEIIFETLAKAQGVLTSENNQLIILKDYAKHILDENHFEDKDNNDLIEANKMLAYVYACMKLMDIDTDKAILLLTRYCLNVRSAHRTSEYPQIIASWILHKIWNRPIDDTNFRLICDEINVTGGTYIKMLDYTIAEIRVHFPEWIEGM